MKKGKKQKVYWSQYRAPLDWSLPLSTEDGEGVECGAWALHSITGKSLKWILKHSNKGHWPTKVMFAYLRSHGFEIIPITFGNIVEAHSIENWNSKPMLRDRNVILLEQACYAEENTWSVLHNNQYSHSGDVTPIRPLEFLNYPVEAAYLVTHKKWQKTLRGL